MDDRTPYDVVVDKMKRWGALEVLDESDSDDDEDDAGQLTVVHLRSSTSPPSQLILLHLSSRR